MRAAAARPAEGRGNGDAMASPFRGGAGSTCSPKRAESRGFLHFTLPRGDCGPEELGVGDKALLDLPSCFEAFPENEE